MVYGSKPRRDGGGNRQRALPNSVTVNSQTAEIYGDATSARTNVTLNNGNNTITASATDAQSRSASASVTYNLPASTSFVYDANGNMTSDGSRSMTYDYDQLLNRTRQP